VVDMAEVETEGCETIKRLRNNREAEVEKTREALLRCRLDPLEQGQSRGSYKY